MSGLGPQRDVYLPFMQVPGNDFTFAVRLASQNSRQMVESIRGAVAHIDADLPLTDVEMLDDRLADQNGAPAAIAALLGGFAAFAMFLAALGVYGVMSQWVAEQTRELGIRIALGAASGNLMRLVLGRGFLMIAIGIAAGMAASWWLTKILESLLYGVGRGDAITLVSVPAVLGAAGIVACWLPLRRALRIDPIVALRNE